MNTFSSNFRFVQGLFLFFLSIFINTQSIAQYSGTLDASFGNWGYVTTAVGSLHSMAYAMVVQTDGKILLAGNAIQNGKSAMTVVRYQINGLLDPSFNNNGILSFQSGNASVANAIVLQPDQKILVAGSTFLNDSVRYFTVVRINPDGNPDSTFGNNGITNINVENSSNIYNIALTSNEKIVISGYSNSNNNTGIALARFNKNGFLDPDFGLDGIAIHHFTESPDIEAWAMALDSNNQIVTTGMIYDPVIQRNKILVARFTETGQVDSFFGINGIVQTSIGPNTDDFGNAIAIQADNKIVVAGTSSNKAIILRYNIWGTPDSSFGNNGIVVHEFENNEPAEAYGVKLLQDQSIIVVGVSGSNAINTNGNFGMFMLCQNGKIDSTFGNNGKVITDVSSGQNDVAFSIQEQSDKKIVVAGISKIGNYYGFAVARYWGVSVSCPKISDCSEIKIYPNPVITEFEIIGADNCVVEIFNMLGKRIFTIDTYNNIEKINISNFSNGIYFVKVVKDKRIFIEKIILNVNKYGL